METRRGRRIALPAFCAALAIGTPTALAGCDAVPGGGGDLNGLKSLPTLARFLDVDSRRPWTMDVEEGEDFDLGSPLE